MEYTKEKIIRAHANAGPDALMYIQELERRLAGVEKVTNDFLQTMGFPPLEDINNDAVLKQAYARVETDLPAMDLNQNRMGDTITLYLFNGDGDPSVSWGGCCGYDAVTMHTETPEEARALYKALLTVKSVDAD